MEARQIARFYGIIGPIDSKKRDQPSLPCGSPSGIYKHAYTYCKPYKWVSFMPKHFLKPPVASSNFPGEEEPAMAEQAMDRELKNTIQQIEKQFGKGAIM